MHNVDTKKVASYWEVGLRTAQNWVRAEYPVLEKYEMATLILEKRLGGAKAREKAGRIVLEHKGKVESEGDVARNNSSLGGERRGLDIGFGEVDEESIDLKQASAWYWAKMKQAAEVKDQGLMSYYHERFLKNEKARRDAEAHARKMGVGDGDIITREVFSQWSYALAFWLVRSVETDQRLLAPQVLDVGMIELLYDPIERFLMRSRFLKAFTKSLDATGGLSLPKWFLEELNAGVEAFFECDRADKDDVAAWDAYQAVLKRRLGEAGDA